MVADLVSPPAGSLALALTLVSPPAGSLALALTLVSPLRLGGRRCDGTTTGSAVHP
jgi:hypothetical protein